MCMIMRSSVVKGLIRRNNLLCCRGSLVAVSRIIDIRRTMSLAHVLGCCPYPISDFVFANLLPITLMPQMVNITVTDPDDAVSKTSGAFAQVNFVAIVRQVGIESSQL